MNISDGNDSCAESGCRNWAALKPRLHRLGIKRLVIVGGTPVSARQAKRWAVRHGMEVELVEGTRRHTARRAGALIGWGDLFLIWASTPLDHRVSDFYHSSRTGRRTVPVHRRGAAAIAAALEATATARECAK